MQREKFRPGVNPPYSKVLRVLPKKALNVKG